MFYCIIRLIDVDPMSETRSNSVYVPRDEAFEEVKQMTFQTNTVKSVLHALLPQLEVVLLNPDLGFPHFTAIDTLFQEGIPVPKDKNFFQLIIPRLVKAITERGDSVLQFETPQMIESIYVCLLSSSLPLLSLELDPVLDESNFFCCRGQIFMVQG